MAVAQARAEAEAEAEAVAEAPTSHLRRELALELRQEALEGFRARGDIRKVLELLGRHLGNAKDVLHA